MKFFHLSDLHIGLKLMNRDLREDQEYILRQIAEIATRERPDAVVIAGDIYDKAVPSAEAVEVFDCFISELREAVPEAVIMMISGNHDSASRVNCFRSVLSRQNLYMVGQPPRTEGEHIEKVTCTDEYGEVNFYLLPFVKPSMVKGVIGTDENGNNFSYEESLRRLLAREEIDTGARNVLVSHQFYLPGTGTQDKCGNQTDGESVVSDQSAADARASVPESDDAEMVSASATVRTTEPGKNNTAGSTTGASAKKELAESIERMDSEVRTVGNIDAISADVLSGFDYVALGHLHKPMKVGSGRIRYCGTPLACSVSEAGQQKGIVVVELGRKTSYDMARETPDVGGAMDNAEPEAGNAKGGAEIRTSVIPLIPLREVRVIRGTLEEVLRQSSQDYVTVILTDKADLEVIDMQERLRIAFPNLLEIRRETKRKADYSYDVGTAMDEGLDPFELCCAFLKNVDEEEKEILRDVIRTVTDTLSDELPTDGRPRLYRELSTDRPEGDKADGFPLTGEVAE